MNKEVGECIEPFTKQWKRRVLSVPDRCLRALIFAKFSRHPQVTDLRTSVKIGVGNGMARTTSVIKHLFLLRRLGRMFGYVPCVDLGCGDGMAL